MFAQIEFTHINAVLDALERESLQILKAEPKSHDTVMAFRRKLDKYRTDTIDPKDTSAVIGRLRGVLRGMQQLTKDANAGRVSPEGTVRQLALMSQGVENIFAKYAKRTDILETRIAGVPIILGIPVALIALKHFKVI